MNNCLIKELKGVVSNGNLPYLNKVVIKTTRTQGFSNYTQMTFEGGIVSISQDNKVLTIDKKHDVTKIVSYNEGNGYWTFKSEDWAYSPLETINLIILDYDVNAKDLPSTLHHLRLCNCPLDIKDLGHLTSLERIMVGASSWSNLTGNVEDFVAAQRANGRTTGSILFGIAGITLSENNVKYQDSVLTGNPKTISWTSDSITVTDYS